MALRQLLSKTFMPTLGRELNGAIQSELSTVTNMVDNMLAPQAYAYRSAAPGVFRGTVAPQESAKKVYVPIQNEGLFEYKLAK
jgi:hypothetical protein